MRKSMLCCLSSLAVACVLVLNPVSAGAASSAPGAALRPSLSIAKSVLATSEPIPFRFVLTNEGSEDLFILKWKTPLAGIDGDFFLVERDGERVAYTGRLVKRAAPRPSDYVWLPAGGSLEAEVDLSAVYDMTRAGRYEVRYLAEGVDLVRVDRARRRTAMSFVTLESEPLELTLEGPDLVPAQEIAALATLPSGRVKSLPPTFVNCSNSHISSIGNALADSESYAIGAYDYLANLPVASRPGSQRYTTWFGAYDSSRYATAQSHFDSIKNAMGTQTFLFNCDCAADNSYYAFVYTNKHYEIHLCGAFFSAPAVGTDSKAGTLIHETSHFAVVASTNDHAYGQATCQKLASKSPRKAVNNADSHEYFAENNPALP